MNNCNIEPSSFLKLLPIEVRNYIYRILLSTKYARLGSSYERRAPVETKIWPAYTYKFDSTILRTNSQIHREATRILYHENLFVRVSSTNVNLGWLLYKLGVPVILPESRSKTFKHCAMSAELDLDPTIRTKRTEEKQVYILASDDLRLFCHGLLVQQYIFSDQLQYLAFKITVHRMFDDMLTSNPAQPSAQRRLLEPFTVLHSIPQFKITGTANLEYCAKVAAKMSRVPPTTKESQAKVLELRDKGHEYARQSDLRSAIETYKMAIRLLLTTCYGPKIADPDEDPDKWQHSLGYTFLGLKGNLAGSHYGLGEFEEAHFWACQAIIPFKSKYGKPKLYEAFYAKLVYLKAIASARLDKRSQAVEELCEGLKHVTKEVYKDEQLVAMRCYARYQIDVSGSSTVFKAMGLGPS